MKNLLERVGNSIRERKLFRRGERILVAVSGGVDSMVLLHVLHSLAKSNGWKLAVAHFNHQLRSRASDADERFVQSTTVALKLPFHSSRGDVRALASGKNVSIEMAARELRHAFLAKAARRSRCRTIALAHHADDQVELFFLRLFRGTGAQGLSGMKHVGTSPVDGALRLVRPLLDFDKAALLEFAKRNGIRFREDASNTSVDILRNRIRHELLPLLRRDFQSGLNKPVLRLMEIACAEAESVGSIARQWLVAKHKYCVFGRLPVGIQRRIIQLQLQREGISTEFDLIESLRAGPGKQVCVSPGLFVVMDEHGNVKRALKSATDFNISEVELRLKGRAGEVQIGEVKITWRLIDGNSFPSNDWTQAKEIFDADKIGHNIVLRHWRAGDRFQPIGMKSPVKLQDWFTNQKIPAGRRRELVLATNERGEIFWVEGLRIGEHFKLTSDTKQTLGWRWVRQ